MLVEKIKNINGKITEQSMVVSLIYTAVILAGLLMNTAIPIIILFAYTALFNKKLTLAVLITLPLYDAYLDSGWLSISKIGIVIMIIVFLINIGYKKIKIGKYEWLILVITAVISFSYIVALLNPIFMFFRDEVLLEYLIDNLPKLGFILTFILVVKTSSKYDMRGMVEAAVSFVPVFVIMITGLSAGSMISVSFRRYKLMNVRPNYFSVFITCMAPFIMKAYFDSKKWLPAAVSIVSLAGTAYLVSLTASRTGFILLFVSVVLSVMLFMGRKWKKLIILIAIVIAGSAGAMFVESFRNSFYRLFQSPDITDDLLPQRTMLLKSAWKIFTQNPILGYGGTKDASAILIYQDIGKNKLSHNAYFDIAIQYGFMGIIAFATLYLTILSDFMIKVFRKFKNFSWQYPIYIVFINILLAGLVLSLNFRDMQVYCLAFVMAMPFRKEIGNQ